jgi:hypothetical protein
MILTIWKKDLKRLWWGILLTTGFLVRLAFLDATRKESMPWTEEAWLSLLLPLSWIAILGMAIHEDTPGNSRAYWASLPVRWQSVVAAKLLFAVTAILVPYGIATGLILQWHGFDWTSYAVELAMKQLHVLTIVVLPGIAIASLFRNLSQAILAFLAAAVFAGISLEGSGLGVTKDELMLVASMIWLGLGAVGVTLLSYAKSGRIATWSLTAIGLAGCIVLAAGFPRGGGSTLRQVWAGTANRPMLRFEDPKVAPPVFTLPRDGRAKVVLPLVSEGFDSKLVQSYQVESLSLYGDDGSAIAARLERGKPTTVALDAYQFADGKGKPWQVLSFLPETYKKWSGRRVTVKGRALLRLTRWEQKVEMPLGSQLWLPQLGKCVSEMISGSQYSVAARLTCLSGRPLTSPVKVYLDDKSITASPKQHFLQDQNKVALLSPVYRSEVYFYENKTEARDLQVEGNQFSDAKLVVTSSQSLGSAYIDFEFRGVELDRYFVKP